MAYYVYHFQMIIWLSILFLPDFSSADLSCSLTSNHMCDGWSLEPKRLWQIQGTFIAAHPANIMHLDVPFSPDVQSANISSPWLNVDRLSVQIRCISLRYSFNIPVKRNIHFEVVVENRNRSLIFNRMMKVVRGHGSFASSRWISEDFPLRFQPNSGHGTELRVKIVVQWKATDYIGGSQVRFANILISQGSCPTQTTEPALTTSSVIQRKCQYQLQSSFACRRGGCVAVWQICDGKIDCPDGSDEENTNCRKTTTIAKPSHRDTGTPIASTVTENAIIAVSVATIMILVCVGPITLCKLLGRFCHSVEDKLARMFDACRRCRIRGNAYNVRQSARSAGVEHSDSEGEETNQTPRSTRSAADTRQAAGVHNQRQANSRVESTVQAANGNTIIETPPPSYEQVRFFNTSPPPSYDEVWR
ncbi:uncharacterized protein LOC141900265 [Tubulanus polymorphus]|uniref:uncharacterized protein LOC141900265 n=1 Tax=Tubulanus polymorphus TaxID=672921 RepID=UPI003DA4B498